MKSMQCFIKKINLKIKWKPIGDTFLLFYEWKPLCYIFEALCVWKSLEHTLGVFDIWQYIDDNEVSEFLTSCHIIIFI